MFPFLAVGGSFEPLYERIIVTFPKEATLVIQATGFFSDSLLSFTFSIFEMSMSSTELEAKTAILLSLADTTMTAEYATMAAWAFLVYDYGAFCSLASLFIDNNKNL